MKVDQIIMDLDGCVYLGDHPINGSPQAIKKLRDKGVKIRFLTNNATKTREDYKNKLSKMGIPVESNDILTSGSATAIYLKKKFGETNIYPIGGKALIEELSREGHKIVEWNKADFVVVCLDFDINYDKLLNATRAVMTGAKLIATNRDPTVPSENGFMPGAGAIVSAIECATGTKAFLVGKPSKVILEIASSYWNFKDNVVMIVGDRLDTDILAGNEMNWITVLVLSGATKIDDLKKENGQKMKPKVIVRDLLDLANRWDEILKNLGE
ncbi:MAG: HAD-IIA family hydrolase [Thermoproteota archaeon]|nr:HAD-IIA family hydrolase [Candidatus Brockarchaeota archaeon]